MGRPPGEPVQVVAPRLRQTWMVHARFTHAPHGAVACETCHDAGGSEDSDTLLLPQIEKRGLIERRADPEDKRVLRLYLTEKGRELTREALSIELAMIEYSMSTTTIEECNRIGEAMQRMVSRVESFEP